MADFFWRLRTKPNTYWTKETLTKLEQATNHWRFLLAEDRITFETEPYSSALLLAGLLSRLGDSPGSRVTDLGVSRFAKFGKGPLEVTSATPVDTFLSDITGHH